MFKRIKFFVLFLDNQKQKLIIFFHTKKLNQKKKSIVVRYNIFEVFFSIVQYATHTHTHVRTFGKRKRFPFIILYRNGFKLILITKIDETKLTITQQWNEMKWIKMWNDLAIGGKKIMIVGDQSKRPLWSKRLIQI